DWSSDVCSSDLLFIGVGEMPPARATLGITIFEAAVEHTVRQQSLPKPDENIRQLRFRHMQQTRTGPYARILRTAYEVFEAQDIDRLAKQLTGPGRQSGAVIKGVNRIAHTLESQLIEPRPTTCI